MELSHDSIPSLLPTIQERLLDCISLVLSKSHYSQTRPAVPLVRGNMMNIPQQISDLNGSALVQLALQTLARFNFKVCIKLLSAMKVTASLISHQICCTV